MVKYGETVWSDLYPGNQHTVNCLQDAVESTESSLELADCHRKRTVWRFDGGAGSDEQFRWLQREITPVDLVEPCAVCDENVQTRHGVFGSS